MVVERNKIDVKLQLTEEKLLNKINELDEAIYSHLKSI